MSQQSFDGSFPDFSDGEDPFPDDPSLGASTNSLLLDDGDSECPMCKKLIPAEQYAVHMDNCLAEAGGGRSKEEAVVMSECPVCMNAVPMEELSTHVDRCLLRSSGEELVMCGLCGEAYPVSVLEMHEEECKRMMQLKNDEELARSLAEDSKAKSSKTPPAAPLPAPTKPTGGITKFDPKKVAPPPIPTVRKVNPGETHECPLCKKQVVMSEMKEHFVVCLKDTKSRQIMRDLEVNQEWTCEVCLEVFVDKDFYEMHSSMCSDKGSRVKCGACGKYTYEKLLEQHKSSECRMHRCSLCLEMFTLEELHTHMPSCSGPKKACPRCDEQIPGKEFDTHVSFCRKNPKCPQCGVRFAVKGSVFDEHMKECKGPQVKCHVCLQQVYEIELDSHLKACATIDANESRAVAWDGEEKAAIGIIRTLLADELTETQLKAVVWTQENSERLSDAAFPTLKERFERLGWNETTLRRTLRYIRTEAPIIVHVNVDNCMKFFLSDTHYRNQFETNTSNGTLNHSIRKQWEDRLFNNIYKNSDGFERVKYGVLNVINDPNGVQCCSQYGDSYLVLKDARLRCTFAAKDSSCADVIPSSVEHYAHTLAEFSDVELREVVAVATRRKEFGDSRAISTYKELQIHGPLELTKHVEALVLNERYANDTKMLEKADRFCRKANARLIIMTPRPPYVPLT